MSDTELRPGRSLRLIYAAVFLLLLGTEVCIALFAHDSFIRPYVGDVLVEVGQAFDLVGLLGLGHIRFFRILLSSTFDWADMVCYLVGGGLILLAEGLLRQKKALTAHDPGSQPFLNPDL